MRLALVMLSLVAAVGCSGSESPGGEEPSGTGGTDPSGTGGATNGTGGGNTSGGSTGLGGDAGGGGTATGGMSGGAGTLPGPAGSWVSFDSPFIGGGSDLAVVKLDDGSAMILGWSAQNYRYSPTDNSFTTMNAPPDGRANTATALLQDGRVLVAGGRTSSEPDGLTSCFLYDPEGDTWTPTTELPVQRARQAALTLPNGNVLVIGGVGPGVGGTPVADVYRYAVESGEWETLPALAQPVRFPALFLLDPQTVLVAAENSQVYDLTSNSVTVNPPLTEPRRYAQLVQLSSGNVLALGGAPLGVLGDNDVPFATVDEYALGASNWVARAPLSIPRSRPGAVMLKDGTVFVAGGSGTFVSTETDSAAQTAERYVPAVDRWYDEVAPPLPTGNPAVLLDDGSVLFVNGARFYPEEWQ